MQTRMQRTPRAVGGRAAPTRPMVVRRSAAQTTTTTAAPAPPKTGQHQASKELLEEALSYFFEDPAAVKVSPTTGGVNNIVQYVDTPEGTRYVLRIYNNGNDSPKVWYEHEVLRQLQLQQDKLSFAVPKAKPSLKDGKAHVKLSTGTEACVFHLMPGSLAKTTSPQEVGRATGELCTAMSQVKIDRMSPQAPYYELYKAHWFTTRENFFHEIETNPEFNQCREDIDYLAQEIRAIEGKLAEWGASDLPKQVLHGDVHFLNVMVEGDKVSGILDFEFCVFDLRACEMAVALSKYVGEENPLQLCKEFARGFLAACPLTPEELAIMPDLTNLRIFSNAVFFVGRHLAKEDSLESLTSRAGAYAKRVKWVNANREALIAALTEAQAEVQN